MAVEENDDEFQKALLDPPSMFRSPDEVLQRADLTNEQKAAILSRWAYDVRELCVAEEEGMGGDGESLLRRIHLALRSLDVEPDISHTPPTKQGAV